MLTVEGDDPDDVHQQLARALDTAHDRIRDIQRSAREDGDTERRPWPMILLVTPKGWTGPRPSTACRSRAPGAPTRCRWRGPATDDGHRAQLEEWMRSYRPEELCSTTTAGWRPSCARWRRGATAG